jgi:hypothetical protein
VKPRGGEDQVNSVVSIDIAGLNQQAARRSDKTNRLLADRGELKLDPVISIARTVHPTLDSGQIRADIPVEVGNCKLWSGSKRSSWRILNVNPSCRAVANKTRNNNKSVDEKWRRRLTATLCLKAVRRPDWGSTSCTISRPCADSEILCYYSLILSWPDGRT